MFCFVFGYEIKTENYLWNRKLKNHFLGGEPFLLSFGVELLEFATQTVVLVRMVAIERGQTADWGSSSCQRMYRLCQQVSPAFNPPSVLSGIQRTCPHVFSTVVKVTLPSASRVWFQNDLYKVGHWGSLTTDISSKYWFMINVCKTWNIYSHIHSWTRIDVVLLFSFEHPFRLRKNNLISSFLGIKNGTLEVPFKIYKTNTLPPPPHLNILEFGSLITQWYSIAERKDFFVQRPLIFSIFITFVFHL